MPYVLKTPDASGQEVVLPGGKLGKFGQGVLAIDYLAQFLAEFQSLGVPLTGGALLAAANNFVNARGGIELANVAQSRIDNYYQELGYPVGFGSAPSGGGVGSGTVYDPVEVKRGTQEIYENQGGVRTQLTAGSGSVTVDDDAPTSVPVGQAVVVEDEGENSATIYVGVA